MDDDRETLIEGFSAVVLAAGVSSRMGRNKLMMEIAGRVMIRHVVETARSVANDVVVVTGHQAERIEEALSRSSPRFVRVDPTLGQSHSIDAGLSASHAPLGTIVFIGDQPRLTEREIAALAQAWLNGDRQKALVPVVGEERGWPMIVPAGFVAGLDLAAPDVHGAHPELVAVFPSKNPVYASSVDTPEDWRSMFAI
jgi:molybdenum cofactor cytidylyltransferase